MKCWIVTEGMAGTENQCLGVSEALGIPAQIKRIALREPWKTFSPILKFETARTFDPPLTGPWPDLLIASGRKSIAASRFIKRASKGKTFTVQIQDPRFSPSDFDLVAVPEHDPTRGKNVIVTAASPNRITQEKLSAAREKFHQFENLKNPRVAVLIGGDSKSHRLTQPIMEKLAGQLKNLDAGLMVTASRRTGRENEEILKQALSGTDAFVWDGTGENPYFGMLAWADYILVTSDSASMLSDAGTTGKPVYMVALDGGSPRLDRLHKNLENRGITRPFEGRLESWSYEPLRDSSKIADEIKKRLAGHLDTQM
jgi:mitochondrial fission protein ELM1